MPEVDHEVDLQQQETEEREEERRDKLCWQPLCKLCVQLPSFQTTRRRQPLHTTLRLAVRNLGAVAGGQTHYGHKHDGLRDDIGQLCQDGGCEGKKQSAPSCRDSGKQCAQGYNMSGTDSAAGEQCRRGQSSGQEGMHGQALLTNAERHRVIHPCCSLTVNTCRQQPTSVRAELRRAQSPHTHSSAIGHAGGTSRARCAWRQHCGQQTLTTRSALKTGMPDLQAAKQVDTKCRLMTPHTPLYASTRARHAQQHARARAHTASRTQAHTHQPAAGTTSATMHTTRHHSLPTHMRLMLPRKLAPENNTPITFCAHADTHTCTSASPPLSSLPVLSRAGVCVWCAVVRGVCRCVASHVCSATPCPCSSGCPPRCCRGCQGPSMNSPFTCTLPIVAGEGTEPTL